MEDRDIERLAGYLNGVLRELVSEVRLIREHLEPPPESNTPSGGTPKIDKLAREANKLRKREAAELLETLNERAGRCFQAKGTNLDMIVSKLKSGFSADDLAVVIWHKCRTEAQGGWKGGDMEKHLTPTTLFGRQKLQQYVDDAWLAHTKAGGDRGD